MTTTPSTTPILPPTTVFKREKSSIKPAITSSASKLKASALTATDLNKIHVRKDGDTVITGRNASLVKSIHGFVMAEPAPKADNASPFHRGAKQLLHSIMINQLLHKRDCVIEEHIIVDDLPDGGVCCLDIFSTEKHRHNKQAPVLALFPALTSSKREYASLIDSCCKSRGMAVAVFNRRGLCEKLATPRFHVMGCVTDTRRMLEILRQHPVHGDRPVFVLGFSMGGGALSQYLTRYSRAEDREVDGIIAGGFICSPVNPRDIVIASPEHSNMLNNVLKEKYVMPYLTWFDSFVHEEITKELLTEKQLEQEQERMTRLRDLWQRMATTINPFQFIRYTLELLKDENPEESHRDIVALERLAEEELKVTGEVMDIEQKIAFMIEQNDERVWSTLTAIDASAHFSTVKIPFLALTTTDDFIVKMNPKTESMILEAPNTVHVLAPGGLHCWFRRNLVDFDPESWGEQLLLRFFTQIYVNKYGPLNRVQYV